MNIIKSELKYNNPYLKLRNNRQDLGMLFKDLTVSIDNSIKGKGKELFALENKLQLLNPSLSLESGYGLLTNSYEEMIKSIDSISLNEEINITIKDGRLKVMVIEIEKGE